MDDVRRPKWTEEVKSFNFQISNGPEYIYEYIYDIKSKAHLIQVKRELNTLLNETSETTFVQRRHSKDIEGMSFEVYNEVSREKALRFHNFHCEFLINCSKYTKLWMVQFFVNIMQTDQELKISEVIVILNLDTPVDNPNRLQTVVLLSVNYKLL